MLYLTFRLLVLLMSLSGVSLADTLVIKKYKRPSKALLNRKIIYMDMGTRQSKQTNSKSLTSLSSPISTKLKPSSNSTKPASQVKQLERKKYKVGKLAKKQKLASIGKGLSKSFGRTKSSTESIGNYDEKDWEDYAEYQDIEMQESLSVNAKLRSRN